MRANKLEDFIDIPAIIRAIRIKKKISQRSFGKKVGVTDKVISAYENGRNLPPIDVFIKILNVGGYCLDIKEDIYKTPKQLTVPLP